MKKFIVLYHVPASVMAERANMEVSEEQKAEGMKAWMDWKERSGDAIVDLGAPLMGGESLGNGGNWAPSNREVAGYSIVQASDKDQAKTFFKGHPHLHWAEGASLEIHEVAPM